MSFTADCAWMTGYSKAISTCLVSRLTGQVDCAFLLPEREWHVEIRAMVNTIVDGTFRQTNLRNESPEYLAKREELRLAEIELMRQREHIAELRRNLPEGAPLQDYQFEEGPRDLNGGDAPVRHVRLSELF